MRFAIHLISHLTPEWRKHYVHYEVLKKKVYEMVDLKSPSDDNGISYYYAPCLSLSPPGCVDAPVASICMPIPPLFDLLNHDLNIAGFSQN